MDTITNLIIFVVLIVMTAFFVSAEFAMVKIRSSRIDQLVLEGKKGAKAAKHVTSHLDEYLSACQLGITVTALGIGMVGEETFEFILHPLFEAMNLPTNLISIFSIAGAFAIATFSHVVIGELAPKTIAIQKAERVTLLFAKPLMFFYKVMFPFIWLLNGSARLLLRLIGMKPTSEHESSHTTEELRSLMKESYESGEINQNELNLVNNVFDFDTLIARELMVPRTEMSAFEKNVTLDELMRIIREEQYTRYPIYEGNRDNVIGYLNIKDLLTSELRNNLNKDNFNIIDWMKPLPRVLETTSIQKVFQLMKKERLHIVLLVDEYGGTSGLLTIEDVIEVIVGEIRDEFDQDEENEIQKLDEQTWKVKGACLVESLEKVIHIEFNNELLDTIGGWYLHQDFEMKKESVVYEGFQFEVLESDGNHIIYLKVTKLENQQKDDEQQEEA